MRRCVGGVRRIGVEGAARGYLRRPQMMRARGRPRHGGDHFLHLQVYGRRLGREAQDAAKSNRAVLSFVQGHARKRVGNKSELWLCHAAAPVPVTNEAGPLAASSPSFPIHAPAFLLTGGPSCPVQAWKHSQTAGTSRTKLVLSSPPSPHQRCGRAAAYSHTPPRRHSYAFDHSSPTDLSFANRYN